MYTRFIQVDSMDLAYPHDNAGFACLAIHATTPPDEPFSPTRCAQDTSESICTPHPEGPPRRTRNAMAKWTHIPRAKAAHSESMVPRCQVVEERISVHHAHLVLESARIKCSVLTTVV